MQGATCSLCSCSVPFLRSQLCHPNPLLPIETGRGSWGGDIPGAWGIGRAGAQRDGMGPHSPIPLEMG